MTDQEKKDFLVEELRLAEKIKLKNEALMTGLLIKIGKVLCDDSEPEFNNVPCTECQEPIGLRMPKVARSGDMFCSEACRNKNWHRRRKEDPNYTTKTKGDGLTIDKVVEIKRLLYAGYNKREVSEKTGIPQGTVTAIHLGRTWTDVKVPKDDVKIPPPEKKWRSRS